MLKKGDYSIIRIYALSFFLLAYAYIYLYKMLKVIMCQKDGQLRRRIKKEEGRKCVKSFFFLKTAPMFPSAVRDHRGAAHPAATWRIQRGVPPPFHRY